MYQYRATITAVYDGDTCTAIVDLGLHVRVEATLRLHGINTPELKGDTKAAGLAARDRLRELVLDKAVTLHTYKDRTEKYGRWLANIFVDQAGQQVNVNQSMIDQGHAVPFMTA